MKTNWKTKINGCKVVLVPYQKRHVEKYHQWMKSTQLQELTGSEPLSLDEEYRMQQSWRDDDEKCTFIVLDKAKVEEGLSEEDCMVGDTNLYLQEDNYAEAEIMIAEETCRGKGFGIEAITIMLRYGLETLGIQKFCAKIKFGNVASEKLFAKLGFQEVSRSQVFSETTFDLDLTQVDSTARGRLIALTDHWQIQHYDNPY